MTARRWLVAAIAAASIGSGMAACRRAPDTDPHLITEWMHTLYGVARAERLSAPVASRLFAYASIGLYSGIAAVDPSRPTLHGLLNGFPAVPQATADGSYDATLAAVAAERVVLDTLLYDALPTTRASVGRLADSLRAARVATGVDSATRERSEAIGQRTGLAIVAWSHGDGFDSTRGRKYVAPLGDGFWVNDLQATLYATQNLSGASQLIVPTDPTNLLRPGAASDRGLILDRQKRANKTLPAANMAGATEPYWGRNRPFALSAWNACPAGLPPAYSTAPGSPMYVEADSVRAMGRRLTTEQRRIALYWADNAGESGTPAGHWLAIASEMVSERHLSAADAAWLMTLTSVSVADGFITVWSYKYQLNLIRPRTYIRRVIDSTWEPAIPTPPFPEFMSGHSAVSAAAAGMLSALLGDSRFEDSTSVPIGHPVRAFDSFTAAANEAGMSRIYGGIHFPSGNVTGRTVGRCIAEQVVARLRATRLR